jgi:hypothetical protein
MPPRAWIEMDIQSRCILVPTRVTGWLRTSTAGWCWRAGRFADADELDYAEDALDQLAAELGGEFDGHDR